MLTQIFCHTLQNKIIYGVPFKIVDEYRHQNYSTKNSTSTTALQLFAATAKRTCTVVYCTVLSYVTSLDLQYTVLLQVLVPVLVLVKGEGIIFGCITLEYLYLYSYEYSTVQRQCIQILYSTVVESMQLCCPSSSSVL